MSDQPGQPTEEQLRAAYEQQIKQLRVDDLLIETLVSLINLAGRKAGLAPGSEEERDPRQLALAIDAVRALMPLCESELGRDAAAIRDALSQLQLAYARQPGEAPAAAQSPGEPPPGEPPPEEPPAPEPEPGRPGEPGPAQRSGRLWVPGQ